MQTVNNRIDVRGLREPHLAHVRVLLDDLTDRDRWVQIVRLDDMVSEPLFRKTRGGRRANHEAGSAGSTPCSRSSATSFWTSSRLPARAA